MFGNSRRDTRMVPTAVKDGTFYGEVIAALTLIVWIAVLVMVL